jgi:hypothetical protein
MTKYFVNHRGIELHYYRDFQLISYLLVTCDNKTSLYSDTLV